MLRKTIQLSIISILLLPVFSSNAFANVKKFDTSLLKKAKPTKTKTVIKERKRPKRKSSIQKPVNKKPNLLLAPTQKSFGNTTKSILKTNKSDSLAKKKNAIIKAKLTEEKKKLKKKEVIDTSKVSKQLKKKIKNISLNNVELKDVLQGLSLEYELNIIVDDSIIDKASINLNNISVLDFLTFLIEEYNLDVVQYGEIIKLKKKQQENSNYSNAMLFTNGKLTFDVKNISLQNFVNLLTNKTEHNFVIKKNVAAFLTGNLTNISIDKGLKAFFESNDLSLLKQNDVFVIDKKYSSKNEQSGASYWINVSNGLISFDLKKASIKKAIEEIAEKVNYDLIVYGDLKNTISAKCTNLTIEQALTYIFRTSDFSYKLENRMIVVGNKNQSGFFNKKLVKLKHLKVDRVLELIPENLKKQLSLQLLKEQNGVVALGTNDLIIEFEEYVKTIDKPIPQILIEALVVDFNTSDIRQLGIKFSNNESSVSDSAWSNYSFLDLGINNNGKVYGQFNKTSLQEIFKGKNLGFLPQNFSMQIQALEQEGKANIKSKPQISTLNGHTASITIGTTQYYLLKSTTPIKSQNDVELQETERFEKIEANIELSITPWATSSGEVTVEIKPRFLTPQGEFNSKVPPTINSRILDSIVRLRDGETIILGGLIEEKDINSVSKVPFLGNLPFIGNLFRTKNKEKCKTIMMIYVTPHVFYGTENDNQKWLKLNNQYKNYFNKEKNND